jgi:hypothetical protein
MDVVQEQAMYMCKYTYIYIHTHKLTHNGYRMDVVEEQVKLFGILADMRSVCSQGGGQHSSHEMAHMIEYMGKQIIRVLLDR